MFWRKIMVDYYEDNDSEVVIKIEEESDGLYLIEERRYDLRDYDNRRELYNKTLDDFDKEYDDTVANALDEITKQIFNEKE